MEKEPSMRDKIIISSIGVILLLVMLTSILNVEIYGRYTICEITEIGGGGARFDDAYYYFYYNGKRYESTSPAFKVAKIGARFLVKFSYKFTNYSDDIQWNYPVPDSIKLEDVPPDGWKEKPSWAIWTPAE